MGRKAIWKPEHRGLAPLPPPSSTYKIAKDYLRFCIHNGLRTGADAAIIYMRSMIDAGLDRQTVAERGYLVHTFEPHNTRQKLATLRLMHYAAHLKREKAANGGPKRKPLLTISELSCFLHKVSSEHSAASNLRFQLFWFVLLCTGARPADVLTMKVRLEPDGISVQFNARKRNSNTSAAYYRWPFNWSTPIPPHLQEAWKNLVIDERLPQIGRYTTVASHINRWLQRVDATFTSTAPRIRMDNVLRPLVKNQRMTLQEFEERMGHKWSTSTAAYAR